jgi:hypothetical protein
MQKDPTMTASTRGNGCLRAFFRRVAGLLISFRPPARRRRPVTDLRDIPDSLKQDIGLFDAPGNGRGRRSPGHRGTAQSASARDRDWQRHLDRSIFPPV